MTHGGADGVVVALCTAPDAGTARTIARTLVEERLAACANVVPGLVSVYRWEGRVHEDPEALLVIKTRRGNLPRLKARLPELHPYDNPELLVAPVEDGLAPYCRWVVDETRDLQP